MSTVPQENLAPRVCVFKETALSTLDAELELKRFQRGQEGVKLGKVVLLFFRRW